jgi:DnaJ-class molecular chaperone
VGDQKTKTCPACHGTGWETGDPLRKDDQGPCLTCNGSGTVPADKGE